MKINSKSHNLLKFSTLPPPTQRSCRVNNISFGLANTVRKGKFGVSTLLHQASASCGRFFCVALLLLALTFTACERDVTGSDPDSLTRTAVDSTATPDDSPLHIGQISIDTAWVGQTNLNF